MNINTLREAFEKAELIKEDLREARKAIIWRGGEIAEDAGTNALAPAIMKIPAYASLAYLTDSTSAYKKTVPEKVESFARVTSVSGKTVKKATTIKNTTPFINTNLCTNATKEGIKYSSSFSCLYNLAAGTKYYLKFDFYVNDEPYGVNRVVNAPAGTVITEYDEYGNVLAETTSTLDATILHGDYALKPISFDRDVSISIEANLLADETATLYPMISTAPITTYVPYVGANLCTNATANGVERTIYPPYGTLEYTLPPGTYYYSISCDKEDVSWYAYIYTLEPDEEFGYVLPHEIPNTNPFTANSEVHIRFETSTVYEETTVRVFPMISTEPIYEYRPYAETLVPTRVTEINSCKKNYASVDNESKTAAGVTIVSNSSDCTIRVNGTASGGNPSLTFSHKTLILEKGKTYTVQGCPDGGGASAFRMVLQDCEEYKQTFTMISSKPETFTAQYEKYYMHIRIIDGYTADNLVFKPMVYEGETGPSIIDTLPIPEEVLNDASWGHGEITDSNTKVTYSNSYSPITKQYTKYIPAKIVFDGVNVKASAFQLSQGVYNALFNITDIIASPRAIISTQQFRVDDRAVAGNIHLYANSSASNIIMYPADQETYTDAANNSERLTIFNNWLKAQYDAGTPVEVVYALKTPEIIAVKENAQQYINTEQGGEILFENEGKEAVKSEINYIEKVGT